MTLASRALLGLSALSTLLWLPSVQALEGEFTKHELSVLSAQYPDIDLDGVGFKGYANEVNMGFWQYLPAGYHDPENAGKLWPVYIYFGGAGERGSGNGNDLNRVLRWGPLKEVKDNGWDYPAIIIHPQLGGFGWPTYAPNNIDRLITFVTTYYNADPKRFYFGGLCTGAGGVMTAVHRSGPRIAAVSAVIPQSLTNEWPYTAATKNQFLGVPTWIAHGFGDSSVDISFSISWNNFLASAYPGHPGLSVMANYPHVDGDPNKSAGKHMTASYRPGLGWIWEDGYVGPNVSNLSYSVINSNAHTVWQPFQNSAIHMRWLLRQQLRGPWSGSPVAVPGVIEAEFVDLGGQNRAYHELDGINTGNSAARARPSEWDGTLESDSVDVSEADDRVFLTDTVTGEWYHYSVAIAAPGSYVLAVDLSGGGTVAVDVGGVEVSQFTLPPASPWTTLSEVVELPGGEQTVTLRIVEGGLDIDSLTIELGTEPVDLIIDNLDPEFSTTGTWNFGISSSPMRYASDYLTGVANSPSTATFTPNLPRSGFYEVSVWYVSNQFYGLLNLTINHAEGSSPLVIDQRSQGGQWVSIGTWSFTEGSAGSVVFSAITTGWGLSVDAVRFTEALPPPPPEPIDLIVDDSDAARVTFTGSWGTSSSNPGFYDSTYRSTAPNQPDRSATYRPNLGHGGLYNVYVWHPQHAFYGIVPVEIVPGDGSAATFTAVDQRSGGSEWKLIATLPLAAGPDTAVIFRSAGATGFSTVADAVRFEELVEDN